MCLAAQSAPPRAAAFLPTEVAVRFVNGVLRVDLEERLRFLDLQFLGLRTGSELPLVPHLVGGDHFVVVRSRKSQAGLAGNRGLGATCGRGRCSASSDPAM